ncbi:MAG: hypothetical protein IKL42_04290 [Clostridia bacterium]|nr:hypothetical protein [Clostridia bacterium]MBR3576607.1 hypothetical protein [Clostridia bacterium]
MVDFHSHFLFDVDDGAKDIEMSLAMLNMSSKQGVTTIVSTPHYYADAAKPHVAATARDESIEELIAYAKQENVRIPEIKRGFEVRVQKKLYEIDDFSELCIENTKTILLEMPLKSWDEDLLDVVEYIKTEKGLDIVIAHLERYLERIPNDLIFRLLEKNLYVQINAGSLVKRDKLDFICELFRNGMAHVIGSDAHNMSSRCSLMDIGHAYIRRNLGQEYVDKIEETAKKLLNL